MEKADMPQAESGSGQTAEGDAHFHDKASKSRENQTPMDEEISFVKHLSQILDLC